MNSHGNAGDWDIPQPYPQIRSTAQPNWQRLAIWVVEQRVARGIKSRAALSRVTGISQRTLLNLEQGRSVSAETLLAVEQALDVPAGTAKEILTTPPHLQKHTLQQSDSSSMADETLIQILRTLEKVHGEGAVLKALAAIREDRDPQGEDPERSAGTGT